MTGAELNQDAVRAPCAHCLTREGHRIPHPIAARQRLREPPVIGGDAGGRLLVALLSGVVRLLSGPRSG